MTANQPNPQNKLKKLDLKKWILNLSVLLILFFVVGYFQNRHLLKVGQKAPDFNLTSLNGETYSLSNLKGKRVILHFWATWCGVCKANIPLLNNIVSDYKDDPVFLSVVSDSKNINQIQKIYKEKGIKYPVLLARPDTLKDYLVQQFPTTYFLDKDGEIYAKDSGLLTPIGLWIRSFIGNFY